MKRFFFTLMLLSTLCESNIAQKVIGSYGVQVYKGYSSDVEQISKIDDESFVVMFPVSKKEVQLIKFDKTLKPIFKKDLARMDAYNFYALKSNKEKIFLLNNFYDGFTTSINLLVYNSSTGEELFNKVIISDKKEWRDFYFSDSINFFLCYKGRTNSFDVFSAKNYEKVYSVSHSFINDETDLRSFVKILDSGKSLFITLNKKKNTIFFNFYDNKGILTKKVVKKNTEESDNEYKDFVYKAINQDKGLVYVSRYIDSDLEGFDVYEIDNASSKAELKFKHNFTKEFNVTNLGNNTYSSFSRKENLNDGVNEKGPKRLTDFSINNFYFGSDGFFHFLFEAKKQFHGARDKLFAKCDNIIIAKFDEKGKFVTSSTVNKKIIVADGWAIPDYSGVITMSLFDNNIKLICPEERMNQYTYTLREIDTKTGKQMSMIPFIDDNCSVNFNYSMFLNKNTFIAFKQIGAMSLKDNEFKLQALEF